MSENTSHYVNQEEQPRMAINYLLAHYENVTTIVNYNKVVKF